MTRVIRAAVVFATLAVSSTPAFAQTLSGRVLDSAQRVVPGATVLVVSGATVVASTITRGDGTFGPIALRAARHELLVSAPGLRAEPVAVDLSDARAVAVDVVAHAAARAESIVVSAAQVDVPLSRSAASVTVITAGDLAAWQYETVAEALGRVPGLHVVTSGGRGGVTSILPRGGESDYTAILADGVPLNAFGGGFDAAHLGVGGIDRIEVVRGPQSALHGGGAIGGIVQLVTRRGGPWRVSAGADAGTKSTRLAHVSSSGSIGSWTFGASADALASDGETGSRTAAGARVDNDDTSRANATLSAGWSDRPDRRARVAFRRSASERGYPGPYGSDPAGFFGGVDTVSRGEQDQSSIAASGSVATGQVSHAALVTRSVMPGLFVSPFGTSEDETRRVTARYQLDGAWRAASWSAGAELVRERADNTFITGRRFQPVPVRRSLGGWFGEARVPLAVRGTLVAGLRFERIQRSALEPDPNDFAPRPAFDDDVTWSANPKLAVAWAVRPSTPAGWTTVRAAAGTGIKPPTAFEIAFTDNPGLAPERSRSLEAGVEHAFARGAVVVDATAFVNRYSDLIVAVGSSFSGASRYRTDNIANARARGLEIAGRWRVGSGVEVGGSLTWLDTEILGVDGRPSVAPSPFAVGDPLVRRPRHRGFADVQWGGRGGGVFASIDGRGRMHDLEPNFAGSVFTNAGYLRVTAGGTWRIARGVDLHARVTNLLNREYEEALGFPSTGRALMVGVRVARGR